MYFSANGALSHKCSQRKLEEEHGGRIPLLCGRQCVPSKLLDKAKWLTERLPMKKLSVHIGLQNCQNHCDDCRANFRKKSEAFEGVAEFLKGKFTEMELTEIEYHRMSRVGDRFFIEVCHENRHILNAVRVGIDGPADKFGDIMLENVYRFASDSWKCFQDTQFLRELVFSVGHRQTILKPICFFRNEDTNIFRSLNKPLETIVIRMKDETPLVDPVQLAGFIQCASTKPGVKSLTLDNLFILGQCDSYIGALSSNLSEVAKENLTQLTVKPCIIHRSTGQNLCEVPVQIAEILRLLPNLTSLYFRIGHWLYGDRKENFENQWQVIVILNILIHILQIFFSISSASMVCWKLPLAQLSVPRRSISKALIAPIRKASCNNSSIL